jgi:tetratricopeptide (TPR) repeat protein
MKLFKEPQIIIDAKTALAQGEYHDALELYETALETGKKERDKSLIVAAENGIVTTELLSGLRSEERIDIQQTLKTVEKTKNRQLTGFTLINMGRLIGKDITHVESDSFSEDLQKTAEDAFLKASELFQTLAKDKDSRVSKAGALGVAETGLTMGRFYLDLEDPEAALANLKEVKTVVKETGDVYLKARFYQVIAFGQYVLGEFKASLKNYKLARRFWHELDNLDMMLSVDGGMGEVYLASGDYRHALKKFEVLFQDYKTLKIKTGQAEMLTKMGEAALGIGDVKQARKHFEKSIVMFKKLHDRRKTVYAKIGGLDTLFLLNKKRFAKKVLLDLLYSEPLKQYPECFNYLYDIVHRESWLKDEKKFMEMFEDPEPLTIEKKLMEEFLQAAKEAHPNEFGAMLHGHPHIHDFEIPPDTGRGARSVTFNLYNRFSQRRISADGVVHSHPSGSARPSKADLSLFGRFRGINIIIGYPFKWDSWAAYDMFGNRVSLQVVETKEED